MTSTQLAVVGGGPGGYAAAFLAADMGLQVTLIDPEPNPGGVCVYRGCIPSKALLHVANVINESRHATAWGVAFGEPSIDLDKLRQFKDQVVARLTSGTGQLAKYRKVRHLHGLAEIVDRHHLRVALNDGGTEDLEFEHAILATGSRPTRVPSLSIDSPRVWDSTRALDLPYLPKTLLVIGGGYIGLELGSVYATLGSEVTIVEMTGGLLPGADRDLVDILAKRIGKMTKGVLLNTKVASMTEVSDGIRVVLDGGSGLHAAGADLRQRAGLRRAQAELRHPGPGADRCAGRRRGFIVVDEQRRTNEPSIFAIGDVVGEPMLAHKASHEGRTAVEAIVGDNVAFEPRAIPAVVYTDPEIAWCGLTEAQAVRENRRVAVAKFPWAASGRAISIDRTDGLTKMVLDEETGRVLGVGLVGSGAGELIAEAVLAIEMGATATDMMLSIHPHPTLTETIMESAEVFFGQATHVYKPLRVKAKTEH